MVTINIQKKHLWFLSTIIILSVGIGFTFAFGETDPITMGHSAEELDGVCLSDGTNCLTGSGPTNCVWETANRLGSNTKDGYYIAGVSLDGCGRSSTSGCISSIYWCQ